MEKPRTRIKDVLEDITIVKSPYNKLKDVLLGLRQTPEDLQTETAIKFGNHMDVKETEDCGVYNQSLPLLRAGDLITGFYFPIRPRQVLVRIQGITITFNIFSKKDSGYKLDFIDPLPLSSISGQVELEVVTDESISSTPIIGTYIILPEPTREKLNRINLLCQLSHDVLINIHNGTVSPAYMLKEEKFAKTAPRAVYSSLTHDYMYSFTKPPSDPRLVAYRELYEFGLWLYVIEKK